MVAQHLGIVRLAARLPLAEVYDVVTDLDMAADTAMGCVEQGDSAMLADLLLAAPHLAKLRFVTPFLLAVHAVLTSSGEPGDDTPTTGDPAELMRSAVENGTDTQRGAGAADCAGWPDACPRKRRNFTHWRTS